MSKFCEIAILILITNTRSSTFDDSKWFHSDDEFAAAFDYYKSITAMGCAPWTGNLAIAIKSKASQFGHRANLRQTWLKDAKSLDIPYFFVLGDPNDTVTMTKIVKESYRNEDLVVGKFLENYLNLTLKGLLTFDFIKTNCENRWLLSVDDDTFVDIAKIIQLVDKFSLKDGHESTVYCHVFYSLEPSRTSISKQMIPIRVYPEKFYPDFCRGTAILYPPKVVTKLLSTAIEPQTIPKLRFDDVFLTGIARTFANCSISQELSSVSGHRKTPLQVSLLIKNNTAVHDVGQDFRKAYEMFVTYRVPLL